jgi:hypothetical protein
MSIPFINQRMKHPCAQFADNTPIKFSVEIFDRVVWAFGHCITAWHYL